MYISRKVTWILDWTPIHGQTLLSFCVRCVQECHRPALIDLNAPVQKGGFSTYSCNCLVIFWSPDLFLLCHLVSFTCRPIMRQTFHSPHSLCRIALAKAHKCCHFDFLACTLLVRCRSLKHSRYDFIQIIVNPQSCTLYPHRQSCQPCTKCAWIDCRQPGPKVGLDIFICR